MAEEDSVSEAMEASQLEASLESIERFSGIKFRGVAEVVRSFMVVINGFNENLEFKSIAFKKAG